MKKLTNLLLVAAASLIAQGALHGEVLRWSLGGPSGLNWAKWTQQNTLVDIATQPTALQPLQLKPDENLVPQLHWTRYKFPIVSYFRPGMPRIWPGTGEISTPKGLDLMSFIDGDSGTYVRPLGNEFFTIDLGAPVPAERMVFYPPEGVDPFTQEPYRPNFRLAGYEISASNDAIFIERETGGYHALDVLLAHVEQNFDSVIEANFPRQNLRFFRLRPLPGPSFSISGERALAEIEVYGSGFVPGATWLSRVVDLGEPVNIGSVVFGVSKWRVEDGVPQPAPESLARATVEIKTGLDDTAIAYLSYNDLSQAVEVDSADYERLKPRVYSYDPPAVGWRGPIVEDQEQWSFWSRPLARSGSDPQTPAGRYMQLRVRLETDQVWEMARLDSLVVQASPLLAERILGEVATADNANPEGKIAQVPIGEPIEFAYAIKGEFAAGQAGFDAVRVSTPAPSFFKELALGQPAIPVSPDSVVGEARGFVVYLPQVIGSQGESSLFLKLETSLYGAAGTFAAEVFRRQGAGFPQQVQGGNASDDIGTDQIRVLALASSLGSVLSGVEVRPATITPQGDGVNDRALVYYTLLNTQTDARVQAVVYSLAGAQVRHLSASRQAAGPQTLEWDGRNEAGKIVPPGLYLVRLEVESDDVSHVATRLIGVAY